MVNYVATGEETSSQTIEEKLSNLEDCCLILAARVKELNHKISELTLNACVAEISKLDIKDGDILCFTIPSNFDISDPYFNSLNELFPEKNIKILVVTDETKVEIIGKDDGMEG